MNRRTPFPRIDTHDQLRALRNRMTMDVLELVGTDAVSRGHDELTASELRSVASTCDTWEVTTPDGDRDRRSSQWAVRLRLRPESTIHEVLRAARIVAKVVVLDLASATMEADPDERVWLTLRSPVTLRAVAGVSLDETAIERHTTLPRLGDEADPSIVRAQVLEALRALGAETQALAIEHHGVVGVHRVAADWQRLNLQPRAVAQWLDAYATWLHQLDG